MGGGGEIIYTYRYTVTTTGPRNVFIRILM